MRWVVVGGGTAGCVAAATVAADPDNDVVVLEAGHSTGERSIGASSLADLDTAEARDGYLIASGLGGASRVNGGLLGGELPPGLWTESVPTAERGPLDRAVASAAPDAEAAVLLRRDGRFSSTAEAFLAPALSTGRIRVEHGAAVDSVLIVNGRTIGARLITGELVAADRVILSAGTFGSPAVLWRSGIAAVGLGEFTDHASIVIDLELRPEFVAPTDSLVTGVVVRRDGIELVPLNHVGGAGAALIAGWLVTPETGRLRLDSQGVAVPELLPHDFATATGLARARSLAAELLDAEPFREAVAVATFTNRRGYFHAVGSCRPVVDERGRVVGVNGLLVADASVLPHRPWGPLAATISVARRIGAD